MTTKEGFDAWFTAERTDTAELFRDLGDALDEGHVTWDVVEIGVPETLDVTVECEREADDRYELELELAWDAVDAGEATDDASDAADAAEATTAGTTGDGRAEPTDEGGNDTGEGRESAGEAAAEETDPDDGSESPDTVPSR